MMFRCCQFRAKNLIGFGDDRFWREAQRYSRRRQRRDDSTTGLSTMTPVLINFGKDSHWAHVVVQEGDRVLVRYDINNETEWVPKSKVDFAAMDRHRQRKARQPVDVTLAGLTSPHQRRIPKKGYPDSITIDAFQPNLPPGWKPPVTAKTRKKTDLGRKKQTLPKKSSPNPMYGSSSVGHETVPVSLFESSSDEK